MPELDLERYRRIPGRRVPTTITVDSDVMAHFGSAEAINELRRLMADKK